MPRQGQICVKHIFEPKNVGLCLCVPVWRKSTNTAVGLESLAGDLPGHFSQHASVVICVCFWYIFMLENSWTYAKITQVMHDALTMFLLPPHPPLQESSPSHHPSRSCQHSAPKGSWDHWIKREKKRVQDTHTHTHMVTDSSDFFGFLWIVLPPTYPAFSSWCSISGLVQHGTGSNCYTPACSKRQTLKNLLSPQNFDIYLFIWMHSLNQPVWPVPSGA